MPSISNPYPIQSEPYRTPLAMYPPLRNLSAGSQLNEVSIELPDSRSRLEPASKRLGNESESTKFL